MIKTELPIAVNFPKHLRNYYGSCSLDNDPLTHFFPDIGGCDILRYPKLYPQKMLITILSALSPPETATYFLLHGSNLNDRLNSQTVGPRWQATLNSGGHGSVGNDTDIEILTTLSPSDTAAKISTAFQNLKATDDDLLRSWDKDPDWLNRLHLATRHSAWNIPDYQVINYKNPPDEQKNLFEFHTHNLNDHDVLNRMFFNYFQFYSSMTGLGGLLLSLENGQVVQRFFQPIPPDTTHTNEIFLTNPEQILASPRSVLTAPRLALFATSQSVMCRQPAVIHPTHAYILQHAVSTHLPRLDSAHVDQFHNRLNSCLAQAKYMGKEAEFRFYLSQITSCS